MRTTSLAAVCAAALAGCATGPSENRTPAPLPQYAGAYPRPAPADSISVRRDLGWGPAVGYEAAVQIAASPQGFFDAVPAVGAAVGIRAGTWPGAVRVASFTDAGVVLESVWVGGAMLPAEFRCHRTLAGPAVPARLVAVINELDGGLGVRVRFEGPPELGCELSSSGRARLQGAASDIWAWARATARAGTPIPGRFP